LPTVTVNAPLWLLIIAGLTIGFERRTGNDWLGRTRDGERSIYARTSSLEPRQMRRFALTKRSVRL
jgi:hypothetical protein